MDLLAVIGAAVLVLIPLYFVAKHFGYVVTFDVKTPKDK